MAKLNKKESDNAFKASIGIIIVSGLVAVIGFLTQALFYILIAASVICIPVAIVFLAWKIYEKHYFSSENFKSITSRITAHVSDCNELNKHIAELKNSQLIINRKQDGMAEFTDESNWNYSRPELQSKPSALNVYNCSRTVCDNARKSPFKYVCKYFGVSADEETLEAFETILNDYEAAEEGKSGLLEERKGIIESIQGELPPLIRKFSQNKLEEKLGFDPVDLDTIDFPKYIFKYVSSGGNASTQCSVTMDIANLNEFILFLSEKIKFKKSAAGQRALMTSQLRQRIKKRDNFTCKSCNVSLDQEPHLLLEIDHIVPISRGGLTEESNLQTLCWRCNRSKGAKIQ